MNYKTNRVNHDFQIAYFLAGSCHTPDGAYALLCDLREDRQNALSMVKASKLRQQAKRLKAEKFLVMPVEMTDPVSRLEAEADLAEISAFIETELRNIAAAEAELATIQKCMDVLEPMRKYAHLELAQAHEAAQFEEWKLELMHRAENHLLTTGMIPTDQFATMRMHPAFVTDILPVINRVTALIKEGRHEEALRLPMTKTFDVPKLLGNVGLPALPNDAQESTETA